MLIKQILVTLLLAVIGCSNQAVMRDQDRTIVNISQFSNPNIIPTVPSIEVTERKSTAVTTYSEVHETTPSDDSKSVLNPVKVGVPLTVEALVGQVNGRPVYANSVLDPMHDQLVAKAKEMSRSSFYDALVPPKSTPYNSITGLALYFDVQDMGTSRVGGEMYKLVINDLLLSEARSGMTKEQEYRLFAVIEQMRSDLASAQGGSQSQMRQDIEQQSGVSVEEFLELGRELILLEALDRQNILPKVNVTWRDIQREFERISIGGSSSEVVVDKARTDAILLGLKDGYSLGSIDAAKGSATIEKIQLGLDDPRIEQVKQGFASGLAFSEVVDLVQIPTVDIGYGYWMKTFKMGMGGVANIDAPDIIKSKLVGAKVGDVLPPTKLRKSMLWVSISHLQKPISLYNRRIQIAVRKQLLQDQFNKEKNRFVKSLWGEGSIHEVKAMVERVANIAIRRYHR